MSSTQSDRVRIPYQPALDGVRAVAVVMVLLFHGGVSWMGGGYFGVSVFFTLSGYLITSLLFNEFASTQKVSPSSFYVRRAKRLLPASVVCLSAVAILAVNDAWTTAEHLKRDLLGSLAQVANWVRLFAGESYIDVQSKTAGLRSPLDHYWSLAIEEQFYWLWPVAFWALARWARSRGWSMTRVIGGCTLVAAACAPTIASVWGSDAAYWATPARASEILLGALIAVALAEQRIRPARWMAPAGLVAVVAFGVLLPIASGPAYSGAFPLLALASAVLLVGLQRTGPVTTVMGWRPFVALGRISYGVYLYHLPIFIYLTADRTGLDGWALLVARLGLTLGSSVVSYYAIERPIRRATWAGARTAAVAFAGSTVVVVLALIVPTTAATYWMASADAGSQAAIPIDQPPEALAALTTPTPLTVANSEPVTTSISPSTTVVPSTSGADTTGFSVPMVIPVLNRPVRILVVGDSTAEATSNGLIAWASANPSLARVSVAASPGCGFLRGGVVASDNGVAFQPACDDVLDKQLPRALRRQRPDVVMMMVTARDISPRTWNGAEGELTTADPLFVSRLDHDFSAIQRLITSSSSAQVVWIRPPHVDPYWAHVVAAVTDDQAHAVIDAAMIRVVAEDTDRAELLDFRGWAEKDGISFLHSARPDGLHFTPKAATDISARWLGPQLLLAATRPRANAAAGS